jgi:hypothetical protein
MVMEQNALTIKEFRKFCSTFVGQNNSQTGVSLGRRYPSIGDVGRTRKILTPWHLRIQDRLTEVHTRGGYSLGRPVLA